MAIFFDSLLKLWMLATKPKLLDWLDELEETVLEYPHTDISIHKYGGSQFNHHRKEFAHLHSNGILDVRFDLDLKKQLLMEGRITDHHVFAHTGWISFYIREKTDLTYAKHLLALAYHHP